MQDIKERIRQISNDFASIVASFNIEEKQKRVNELQAESVGDNFWRDQENARHIMQELSLLKEELQEVKDLEEEIAILTSLLGDPASEKDLAKELPKVEARLAKFKLKSFLSDEHDRKNAIVSVHAGQGGTEAMDWASMLYRMYLRYCERKGWKAETVDSSEGEEAGIKSATFKVEGTYAYGYLKGEAGTHRLVRQSPFNADNLRQTSFALVEVLPELDEVDLPGVDIKDEDLDWQFFRASSQGGQNVQKVSTAVRLKHLPTGIVVTAQTERFQEQNRKIALSLLRSKLWILAQENKEKTERQIKGEYRPASWGNQIRSYVLHPYKMVKDLRTEVESSNPEAVLGGEIDEFVDAEIRSSL